jgi:dCTP deaminase
MILSNTEILKCLDRGDFTITPHPGNDTTKSPYNTSAIDLKLGNEIRVPKAPQPVQLDLTIPGISNFLHDHTELKIISNDSPYSLRPNKFILARTLETVDFPLTGKDICYSARVEGKSSLARCGILIHFTAPTIHAGFSGIITLEIINLGVHSFLLTPEMFICQLIIEEVKGSPINSPNQFSGQKSATGKH